ncbi:MAG: acetyl-CoA carboxylase, carboxyltransferase subunit beta [Clostridiales bacterium]|nr:acetyl-CoA carboxylase, carboxyltransferase subunit beta [Clostridiales bacterium]
MGLESLFSKKPKNELEKGGRLPPVKAETAYEISEKCPNCGNDIPLSYLWENLHVCRCGHCFRMNSRQRIRFMTDKGSFTELWSDMESADLLNFPGYKGKLESTKVSAREKEAVICGEAAIGGAVCAMFVMEPYFMMGSMGTVAGEKITRLFEYATEKRLPVVGCTVSGGARMQEGILSLMQMAKTSGALKRHSDSGLLYITVITDPTTGGVTASFAMAGDIIIAEPSATIGFAGARLVEQTVRKKLPQGFQKAETMLEHGFIDLILPRREQKQTIGTLLAMHNV